MIRHIAADSGRLICNVLYAGGEGAAWYLQWHAWGAREASDTVG